MRKLLLLLLLCPCLVGCGLPYDASDSLEEIRGGRLRVGEIAKDEEAHRLLVAFAEKHGATLEVTQDAPAWLLKKALLEQRLHIVYGQMTEDTPFRSEAAFSQPYSEIQDIIEGPRGNYSEEDWKDTGLRIESEEDTYLAFYYSEKPPQPDSPFTLRHLDKEAELSPRQQKVGASRAMVFIVSPGENRLLVELDRFLLEQSRES